MNQSQIVKVPVEWSATTGEGATVMICDTGCDENHPALVNNIVECRSFLHKKLSKMNSKHCTHVAGIIAGSMGKFKGVAPMSKLYIAECLVSGTGTIGRLQSAIEWAKEVRPDVLNLSLAYPTDKAALSKLFLELDEMGVIVCASNARHPNIYPAYYESVISVASFDRPGDDLVDVFCPGDLMSSVPGGTIKRMDGNSMACAYFSGLCALAKAYDKSLDRKAILETLRDSEIVKRERSAYRYSICTP